MESLSAEQRLRVHQLIVAGQKMQAIKLYRQFTGVGVRAATDAIDAYTEQVKRENPSLVIPQAGCAVSLLLISALGIALVMALAWALYQFPWLRGQG